MRAVFPWLVTLWAGALCRPENVTNAALCPGAIDKGPCSSHVYKWGYNADTKSCVMFVWGGCAGNEKNRFDSELLCIQHCSPENYTLPLWAKEARDLPPIPREQRGPQLTFQETGRLKTFMFAQSNTFIQIDGDIIQTFQLRLCRQISFQFRTRLPHGLLVYHNVQVPSGVPMLPYALYVIVQQGQLKVVHVYGKHSTALTVGRGLNRDEWHSVTVRIDVHGARLMATVDELKEETDLKGLDKENNYGVSANLTSVILIGGLSSEEKLHGVKYIIESFVGCIKDVVLSTGKSASDLLPIVPLIATKHENVQEGCINKCHTNENLCFVGARCINHYYTFTCDCFGTYYEGELCDIYTATVLTLRGSSYVSYRVYDWKDRVHSAINRFSMLFKTRFDDSALFYASGGEQGINHYIAASIYNNSIYINMDFGDGLITTTLGQNASLEEWNNLTIFHENNQVQLSLNDEKVMHNISGSNLLYIDPEIYIGGGPELHKKKGAVSTNNFAGCLKYVFYNDISIIYELKKMNPKVHYIGVLQPEFYEADVEVIPITYPFASSHIWWPNNQTDKLSLTFDFKSSRSLAGLAASEVSTAMGNGYWELRVVNEEIRFELVTDNTKNVTHLISVKHTPGDWHTVEVTYADGALRLAVDHRNKEERLVGLQFTIGDKVLVGSGYQPVKSNSGLVGCMRDIVVNGAPLEPRMMLQSERVVGEVALDDCRYVDPCHRPNTCEHGGKCSVKEDRLTCDCSNTGYTGKNCHFAKYPKTCEELALLGYTKSDVYTIDIDGNGRFPPARVRCEFQSLEDSTKTIVEHNLPSQVDVRSASEKDFSFNIKYREFSADMLQELVSHSLNCSQYIRYDCFKAPLDLHSATWFISSANHTVDYLGDVKRGTCPCAIGRKCESPSQWCNCDVTEAKWNSDEGSYVNSHSLGITEMVFIQQQGLADDAQGRITLGPLECVETNTQKYVVTFTTSQSYIEVPGWRKGDLAFSFRTTGKSAILLYQPPIRPNYPSFMVALTSDYQLTFNFTLNTGVSRGLVIRSARQLNAGEWHKLWIDYNKYHVRFMINTDRQMVDLKPEEEFGPFEGSMFIGGAPFDLLDKPSSTVHQGLIGCFRGLVVNEEILDIYSYMSVHLSEIIKDCKPSCVPNPCKNGAQCKELWRTFECICPNPWSYRGEFCETDINTNALTFTNPESYLKRNYLGEENLDEKTLLKSIFQESMLINLRTYDTTALVLYANDHLNNFIHMYIKNGSLTYLFNNGDVIHNITVYHPELNSSKSAQIAVERNSDNTTLHVNDRNKTIPIGVLLLDGYDNKPWNNSEKEVLAPQRPPAPPTDYFQLTLGGYDPGSLLFVSEDPEEIPGYVGCLRGFQIGATVIDLPPKIKDKNDGVLAGCNMKCDTVPCKQQGICIEDFRKQEHTCNCEHTSYYGEFCSDEKGADFSGDSSLRRKYILNGSVDQIKLQLAFSSNDLIHRDTVLLLLQTENNRSYYLVVALTMEGFLTVIEDRENATFRAIVRENSFLNGARHSVYYRRYKDDYNLMIDRQQVSMEEIQGQSLTNVQDTGENEVHIGGVSTTDPRFATHKGYSGCLSNIFLEVNHNSMKPLEEYMLFTKSGPEEIIVTNSQGIRSAQCSSEFDIIHRLTQGPGTINISQGIDKTWVEEPPLRVTYKSLYSNTSMQEEGTGRIIVIALSVVFVVVILGCSYELYRTDKAYRRRKELETDASILWSKEQATKLHQEPSIKGNSISMVQPKGDPDDPPKPLQNGKLQTKPSNGTPQNGTYVSAIVNQTAAVNPAEEPEKSVVLEPSKRIGFRDSASELEYEDNTESTELLPKKLPEVSEESEEGEEEEEEEEEEEDYVESDQHFEVDNLKPENNTTCPVPTGKTDHTNVFGRNKIVPSVKPNLAPVYLDESKRTFNNPISYLGGPRLTFTKPRTSLESVLSLD